MAKLAVASLVMAVLVLVAHMPGTEARKRRSPSPPAPPPSPSTPIFTLPPLQYPYDAIEPSIDNETMVLHHTRHHASAVTGLNVALAGAPAAWRSLSLEELNQKVGTKAFTKAFPAAVATSIANNGGSHWNHAFFWKLLSPASSSGAPSARLADAINRDFGSLDGLFAAFNTSAAARFGSGWAWVCVLPGTYKLAVVSTPNQVNPLQALADTRCTPILGLDVWEHAYYLKYRNVRGAYIGAFRAVINWARVSETWEAAIKGNVLPVV